MGHARREQGEENDGERRDEISEGMVCARLLIVRGSLRNL